MAIPPYKELFLPILKTLSDGQVHDNKGLWEDLATALELSEADREATFKSGANIFANRVGWASLALVKSCFAERPIKGHLRILPRGSDWLRSSPKSLLDEDFQQFPEFQAWIKSFKSDSTEPDSSDDEGAEHINRVDSANGTASLERVGEYVAKHYPDPEVRRECLERLARSIRIAHAAEETSWKTTFSASGIALFAGPVWSVIFQKSRLDLVVFKSLVDTDLWNGLLSRPGVGISTESFKFNSRARDAFRFEIPANLVAEASRVLSDSHEEFLRFAVECQPKGIWGNNHDSAVLEYLRQELDIDLPNPDRDHFREGATIEHKRFWKISPGADGVKWGDFHDHGYAAIDFDVITDLSPYMGSTYESLKSFVATNWTLKPGALGGAAWQFHHLITSINIGDRVLAYSDKTVLGWGTVTSEYFYVSGEYGHRRKVKWEPFNPVPASSLSGDVQNKLKRLRTLFELTEEEFEGAIGLDGSTPPLPFELAVPTISDLAGKAFMAEDQLAHLEALIRDKRQIVLEGPPGSGKTYVADLLARYLTGNPLSGEHNEQIEIVQFHQSYGYEDFVQGIRPVVNHEGQIVYAVQKGIFAQMCDLAAATPDLTFVLIIDEINRGNISRIFGELLMLLEYRNRRVRLPYSDGDTPQYLAIPPNLLLIGTMNSTDRSLALIDYALRRRFFFYRLLPMENERALVYEQWLDAQSSMPVEVRQHRLRLFIALNRNLATHHLPVDFQIGHSYFMTSDIGSDAGLDKVWNWAILPLLQEYFHSAKDVTAKLASFNHRTLAPFSQSIDTAASDPDV